MYVSRGDSKLWEYDREALKYAWWKKYAVSAIYKVQGQYFDKALNTVLSEAPHIFKLVGKRCVDKHIKHNVKCTWKMSKSLQWDPHAVSSITIIR